MTVDDLDPDGMTRESLIEEVKRLRLVESTLQGFLEHDRILFNYSTECHIVPDDVWEVLAERGSFDGKV